MSNTEQLAINGGPKAVPGPLKSRFHFGVEEKEAAMRLFDASIESGNAFGYNGPEEEAFGKEFAEFLGGGYADVLPSYYRDVPGHIRREYEYDACYIAVSPMDKHGYFSTATSCSYTPAMIEKSKRIYLEVNRYQPRCVSGVQIHISQVAGLVENHHPLPVMAPTQLDEKSILIGNLIAEQIPDGACLQLGIGAMTGRG